MQGLLQRPSAEQFDPNLFHIDWGRTTEVLMAVIVIAMIVERSLSLLFENRRFLQAFEDRGVKEPIAFAVSFVVCWYWHFDAVSMILLTDHTTLLGEALTAGVIAGGAKASVKLFRDVMGARSSAFTEANGPPPRRPRPPPPPSPQTTVVVETQPPAQ